MVYDSSKNSVKVYDPSAYTDDMNAVAVCVIPTGILPDNMARFVLAHRPKQTYAWGKQGTLIPEYTTVYQFEGIDGSIETQGLMAVDQGPYVSDLKFLSETDHQCGYIDTIRLSENQTLPVKLPTPYIEDQDSSTYILNPAYRSTENAYANAMYDVQGVVNTSMLLADGDHPIAEACHDIDFIGDGFKRCFIPSTGEVGFLFARLNKINTSLELVGGDIIPYKFNLHYNGSHEEPDFFWTSTQSSANTACIFSAYTRVGDSSLMYIEDSSNPYGGHIGAQGYKNDSVSMGLLPFIQVTSRGVFVGWDASTNSFIGL